jgi:hypothetical protein
MPSTLDACIRAQSVRFFTNSNRYYHLWKWIDKQNVQCSYNDMLFLNKEFCILESISINDNNDYC